MIKKLNDSFNDEFNPDYFCQLYVSIISPESYSVNRFSVKILYVFEKIHFA